MVFAGIGADAAAGATVTISGESVTVVSSTTSSQSRAGIRVNTDGTIDKRVGNTYTQIDSATDWIIPNGSASSTYQIRITNVTWLQGSAFNTAAAAADTWIDMSADREWSIADTAPGGTGIREVTFDLEIRLGEGATIDSGSFYLYSEFETGA